MRSDDPPNEFIGDVLVKALGARHVVVGHDFKFGRGLAGNVETLRALGPAAGSRSPKCRRSRSTASASAVR